MQALVVEDEGQRQAAIDLARCCRQAAAAAAQARSATLWDAIMAPESLLVEHLLDGTLLQADEAGEQAFSAIARAYDETLSNLTVKPLELDSVVTQLRLLSRFCNACALARDETGWTLAATRLRWRSPTRSGRVSPRQHTNQLPGKRQGRYNSGLFHLAPPFAWRGALPTGSIRAQL
jgi:hypothetical protein